MVALIVALLMLQLTTPSNVGLIGVLVFFLLLYVSCACLVYVVFITSTRLLSATLPQGKWRSYFEGVSIVKIYYYSSILALLPVILLGMNSVGTIRLADLSLLILFEVLGCLYISKRF